MYFTYILQNLDTGRYYIGHCDNLIRRFNEHRYNKSKYTRNKGPWWMPYFEIYSTRSDAVQREMAIKRKKSRASIRRIILYEYPDLELHLK